MSHDAVGVLGLFWQAGLPVKGVVLLLLGLSVWSWRCMIQQYMLISEIEKQDQVFEAQFWSKETQLDQLFERHRARAQQSYGLMGVFYSGYECYAALAPRVWGGAVFTGRENAGSVSVLQRADWLYTHVQRAMSVTQARGMPQLERHLRFLATVGSVSPYIGLLGTVWGIMSAFQSLGMAAGQQNSIATVGPGIAEALVTTALGLFAAIPALVAYNWLSQWVDNRMQHYHTFQEEFIGLIGRQHTWEEGSTHPSLDRMAQ